MFDKKEKQLINLVHVIALSALHQANPTHKTETELKKYAFPLELDLWFVVDVINAYQKTVGLINGFVNIALAWYENLINGIRK